MTHPMTESARRVYPPNHEYNMVTYNHLERVMLKVAKFLQIDVIHFYLFTGLLIHLKVGC